MKNSGNISKAFALVFAVTLFVGIISLPMHSNAAPAVQLTVSDVSGKAGDEVTVSITISPDSELGAADLLLKYDASKLKYEKYQLGPAVIGGIPIVNPNYKAEGDFMTMICTYINANGVRAGGSMLDLTFTIRDGWSGQTPLTLTVKGFAHFDDYSEIPYTVENGKISIGTPVPTTTKPDVPSTTNPDVDTTAAKPTTTKRVYVTREDGSKVTETDNVGSTVFKTSDVYETLVRTEIVTEADGSKIIETNVDGFADYKTTVIYEKVVGTEYVLDEDGSKVFETDEDGSTVYKTTLIYETFDIADLEDKTEDKDDDGAIGSMSTARKTVIIVAIVCALLLAAALIVYKRKKGTAE